MLVEFLGEVLTSRWEFTKFPTAYLQNPSGQLYARVPVINTGKPGLALVIRYAPTRSPTRMMRRYTAAIVMHIFMKHAETLPQQYTAKGLKSTRGIYRLVEPYEDIVLNAEYPLHENKVLPCVWD